MGVERMRSVIDRLTSRPVALALALGLLLALGVGVRTFVSPEHHTVFPIFAASASHWWHHESLYAIYPPLDQFRYPPPFAVAVTPFSVLGLRVGGTLWVWFSMAVYGAGLWCFARDVLPPEWTRRRTALFLVLGGVLALPGIWNAQSNALVVALVLLAAAALVRERWWLTAGLLATTVWIKLTPLAPALLFCALWPRQLAPRFVVALLLGSLIPFLTSPPDQTWGQYGEWTNHLLDSGTTRWPGFRDGWTLWLTIRHLLGGSEGPVPALAPVDSLFYRALQLLSAVAVLCWCLWQRQRGASTRGLVCLTLSMGMAWLMLFGPAVEYATYVFLGPSLAWACLDPRGRWLIVPAFCLIAVLGWEPSFLVVLPLGATLFTIWLLGYASPSLPSTAERVNQSRGERCGVSPPVSADHRRADAAPLAQPSFTG